MSIQGRITPNPDILAFHLGRKVERALGEVGRATEREAINLVSTVKEKLTDNVLRVRTGRLRRSITYRYQQTGQTFQAWVGTNVSYARALENGFTGTVNVKAHLVREHQRKMKVAFGKPMANPRSVRVQEHTVKAHPVKMNIKPRRFLASSLEENTPRIQTNLREAIARGLRA